MTPYYEDDLVTLYHGDCLAISEWLSADVLVTDPPYGMSYEANFNRHRKTKPSTPRPVINDMTTEARDAALTAWGARPALVFGRWNVPRPTATKARLIWDRMYHGMGDLAFPWGPAEEEIYVLGDARHFKGTRVPNVIRAHGLMSGSADRPNHPTPKPIGLMEHLISRTTGTVADPFAGSGSTLIAARNLGRAAIGVELEEKYCELIAMRLSQQTFDFGDDWDAA